MVLDIEEIRTLIGDDTPTGYMAKLIKKVEDDSIALRKAEINLGILKQMNNRARIITSVLQNNSSKPSVGNSGAPHYILTIIKPNGIRHKELIDACLKGGFTDSSARAAIHKLAKAGILEKRGRTYYIVSNPQELPLQDTQKDFFLPKHKVLKLLYLAYPNMNINKLADAIGVPQPSVHQMIFK